MKIAYIDFQNIKLWARELGRDIDWSMFFYYLMKKYKFHSVKLFLWFLSQNIAFYDELKKIWYTVVFKKTIEVDWKIKGNIDTCLMREALQDSYDNSVNFSLLVSGDWDFDELLRFWQTRWQHYKVMIPNHTKTSQLLLETTEVSERQFMHTIQHIIQTKKPSIPK